MKDCDSMNNPSKSKFIKLSVAVLAIAAILVSSIAVFANRSDMMNITMRNSSDYVIVYGANCSSSELNAAKTLQDYISRICGVVLPVVTDSATVQNKEIIVGKTNREGSGSYTIDRATLGDEGLIIKTVGKKLIIAGGEKRGTLYGVYTFLEEILGCHWYTSTLTIVPQVKSLQIPVNISIEQKPAFEFRETNWISASDKNYSMANKLNGNIFRKLSEEQGGTFGYTGGFSSTIRTTLLPASQYFAAHPEYYAFGVISQMRTPNQICMTNPAVLSLVIQKVRDILISNPNAKIISVTQNDNLDYCVCDNCKAVDDYEGSHAGTMIRFVNAVADAIKDDYPNVMIDTFAYNYTRKPPLHVIPRANVIVRICSSACCFAHKLNDPLCTDNLSFYNDLKGWEKICNKIYVWDYTANFSYHLGPFNDFGVIQPNMQFFAENNIKGIFENGLNPPNQRSAEFAELRGYMLTKLMWNPYLDYDKTINGFLSAYYGKGWQYVRNYINVSIKNTIPGINHMKYYAPMTAKGVFDLSQNEINVCNNLWAKAAALAQTPEQLKNVKMSELSWRYWKGSNMVSEFSRTQPISVWQAANEALYNDYVKYGIVVNLPAKPDFSLTPDKWGTLGN